MPETRPVITFSKREGGMPMPHLLDIQTAAFQTLLVPDDVEGDRQDVSLERVFRDLFPITDVNEKYKLEFLGYSLGEAKYAVEECVERDMTYAAPLKAKLRLDVYEEVEGQKRLKNAIEKEVYLGELPIMTPLGTFVINGAERVVVSQLHRSPGVVFEEDTHPNGQRLFSARIIPFRGSWVEFTIDIHDVIYVHIDKKKKFPATALLRAFGHGNNADILKLFFATKQLNITGKLEGRQEKREVLGSLLAEDVPNPEDPKGEPLGAVGDELTQERLNEMRHKGLKAVTVFAGYTTLDVREEEQPTTTRDRSNYVLAFDAADPETGEVVAAGGSELTDALRKKLIKAEVHKVEVLLPAGRSESPLIKNTLAKDPTHSEAEALEQIYALLRPGDAPNLETARQQLQKLFFNPKRYDLGRVGRYKINQRLKLRTDANHTVLTEDDFVAIIRYLIDLHDGRGFTDDIDHLGNRRIRSVGELIANQFSVGLSRMARLVKERMSINSDPEKISLDDLVNARTVSAVIQAFFGSSQLSQFMDQTNPLAELTNKRRLSALGPGGLTRERAGFEVRDVHYSQYGRMCPIETPEGPNIGLITSLSTYARINELGFIETPYRVVKNGKVTDDIRWLSASDEEDYAVAQANAPLTPEGAFAEGLVLSRKGDDYPLLPPDRIEFMDVAPEQLVSIAAALIPFLEHDDANRALMGSNMQRQSVPLLFPQAPLVGTGLEEKVARDSGAVISARRSGTVTRVTADEIIVDAGANGTQVSDVPLARLHQHDRYRVKKFWRTNQDTAINQRPLVQLGQQVQAGEIIADGAATEGGELALGSNVLVAFMPWYGHNFEDAIVLSERLVKDDVYSSIHIQELELHVRDTKRGQEEITREIPNVSDESVVDLDERGIVRIGAHVKPGDILVGKITPKGETELSPEEKLLTAIFGEKAKDVKDSSLKVPPGMAGVVIDVKIFSRIEDQVVEKDRGERIGEVRRIENDEKARINTVMLEELRQLLAGQEVALMLKAGTVEEFLSSGTKLTAAQLETIDLGDVDLKTFRVANKPANERIRQSIDMAARERAKVEEKAEDQIDKILQPDELPPGVIQLVKVYLAEKRKISVGDKMAGRHGNKGIVARIVPEEDMPFLPDGTPVDIVLNPLGVPSRMNVGQILETHLGWAARILGFEAKTPVFRGADETEIGVLLRLSGFRWAAEGLQLRQAAPALLPAAITRLVHDLKKVAPKGEHTTLGEAGVSMLGARHSSAETKEVFGQVRGFLVEAAKELAERELAQRRQEVEFHKAAGENGSAKALGKAVKDLEKAAAASPAEALEAAGKPALAGLLG
ncbi:MAG: DNA-directed RNA polymerase subunit beta, partial [Gemmatimonadales bacterium]